MSIFYNPKTIIDGLVLALDAGNIKSYNVGISTTTWTDIIGRGNTGTLTNGPSYSSQNGGSIVFNGENNYVENLAPNLGISGNTSVTLSCWFYNSVNSSDNQALLVYGNGSTGGDSISILLQSLTFYASFNGGLDAVIADNVYALNTWNNVVVTKTPGAINTTTKLYLNGVEQTITSASSSTPSLSSRVVRVGRWTDDASPYYFLGGVSAALIYNRALTAAEVLQNYNSLKNRFVTAPVLIPVKPPYQISRSLRFNSADSAYLNKTFGVSSQNQKATFSCWVKRSNLGTEQGILRTDRTYDTIIDFLSTDTIRIYTGNGVNIGSWNWTTTQVFRDPNAWFYFLAAWDTTQVTANDRLQVYINGSLVTAYTTRETITQNMGLAFSSASVLLGKGLTNYFNGYLADVHFIDGQALTPSSFTEINGNTGQLIPKFYSGTYGVNGFRLNFSDNSAATAATLGADSSGNGNNWTPNNLSVTAGAGNDILTDTPTSYGTDTGAGAEVRGNYATLNPLINVDNRTLSNGNLDMSVGGSNTFRCATSTISVRSGKYYCEISNFAGTGASFGQLGLISGDLSSQELNQDRIQDAANVQSKGYILFEPAVNNYRIDSGSGVSYTISGFTTSDVLGFAWDADNKTCQLYKNGAALGSVSYSTSNMANKSLYFTINDRTRSGGLVSINFGQRPFAYAAPSGFKALCDTNLPTPTIAKGSSVFDATLYTGTGAALTPTSSLAFSPDLVWIKGRSGATDHALYDTVRGATFDLVSNSTAAETTQTQGLTAFNSNGFSVGTLAKLNTNAATYAGWAWDAGSSTVTNTAGTITSQVRANASAGFSVVTYTGNGATATVGHGLGVAPSLILCKTRAVAVQWTVYHASLGKDIFLGLNNTDASFFFTSYWGSGVTSTVFGLQNAAGGNNNGNMVAYCFAPVTGYSSFGSYTGNGSTDGPFVYTGFRPRWILVKRTDGVIQWTILDTSRSPVNVADQRLFPNLSQGETVNGDGNTDLLSNGFKLRNIDSAFNTNGATYIYAAFAENPFQYSRAR